MDRIRKIAGYNLLALVIYTALNGLIGGVILLAVLIALHFFFNFILGIVHLAQSKFTDGKAYMLSAFLVVLIGFSACFGIYF